MKIHQWVADEKHILLLLDSFMNIFVPKPLGFKKVSHSSEMQKNVAWGLKSLESLLNLLL